MDNKQGFNKKLNILYIAHERKLGGASLSLVTLVEEMKNRGHNVYVVVPFYNSPIAKHLRKNGIKTIGIFFGWWMYPSYWNYFMRFLFKILYFSEKIPVYMIKKTIKKYKIDIVHSNSSVIDVGEKAAKFSHIPHVWHFREFGDLDYELEFLKGREESIKNISQNQGIILFISRCLESYYRDIDDKTLKKVVYNGVSTKFIIEEKKYMQKDNISFLIAGNLQVNKKQNIVLEAANILVNQGIKNFRVFVAGEAANTKRSRKYKEKLISYIKEKHLEENVIMLGRIQNMTELRKNIDVEIVPSSMEAFGRVTVEAMMGRIPVLASDAGANPELIEKEKNGWLFQVNNPEALAEKMYKIIRGEYNLDQMSEYAYKSVRNKFTSDKNTNTIEEIYYSLL